jgi:hypothetical protein
VNNYSRPAKYFLRFSRELDQGAAQQKIGATLLLLVLGHVATLAARLASCSQQAGRPHPSGRKHGK